MKRQEMISEIIKICNHQFEIENPDPDDDLREKFGFDSIDGIELLIKLEEMLQMELTQNEKKQFFNVRTINQACDYIEMIIQTRSNA